MRLQVIILCRSSINAFLLIAGEQMNKFVNDNSDIIFKEFKGSFERTFAAAFLQVTNKILNSVPYDKLHSA